MREKIKQPIYLRGTPNCLLGPPLRAGGIPPAVAIFVPTISIFMGFPSSSTLLYLLTAARASTLLEKTMSAVPCGKRTRLAPSQIAEYAISF